MDHKIMLDALAAAKRRVVRDLVVDIITIVVGIGGLVLIGIFGNWMTALGVFFVLWGHNIDTRRK